MNEDGKLIRIVPALSGRDLTVEDMDLEVAVRNALKRGGIHTLDQLLQLSHPELVRIFPNRERSSYENVIHCLVCLSEETEKTGTSSPDFICEENIGNTLRESKMPEKKFNIFQVAGIWKSEEIHTSVIAELINPKSEFHDKGAAFLEKFLQMQKIGVELTGEKLEDAVVETEVPTNLGRRIDMVISTKNLYLPFEVKIWAGDQGAQLQHYYEFAKSQGKEVPAIYYLTPEGHEPSEQSRGDLGNAVHLLSFQADILPWLEECMKDLDIPSDVHEIIKQLHNNIQGGPDTQVRSGVPLRCFSKWEKKDVLDAIYQKLSLNYDIPWTECTPTYMTFTLNKMEFGTASLEFALRLKKERVKKERAGKAEYGDRVRLYLICGLTQEDGTPDYAAASSYISKNPENFERLRAHSGLKVKSGKATWDWLPEKVCFDDAEKCCDWIEEKYLRSSTPQSQLQRSLLASAAPK